jgi:hypothetical protein
MGSCNTSTNCNPCGPEFNAFNQLATRAGAYARQANTYAVDAENSWLEFNALYLGSFAVAPTVDNEGNPLQVGALYWNSVSNTLFAWNGTAWATATNFNEFTPFLANGTTTARNLVTREADVVNVKDFGAVGDGVTDDTAAIQAAINSTATNNKLIFLPEGQYLIAGLTVAHSNFALIGSGASSVLLYNGNGVAIDFNNGGAGVIQFPLMSNFGITLNGDTCVGIKYTSPTRHAKHEFITFLRPFGNSTSNLTDFSIGVSYEPNGPAFTGIHQYYCCRWERFATAIDVNPTGTEVTELLFESCVFNAVRKAIFDRQSAPNAMPCTFRVDKCVLDVSANAENIFYTDVGGCQITNTRIESKTGWQTCVAGSTTERCYFHFGPNSIQNVVENCAFIPLVNDAFLFEGIRNFHTHPQLACRMHRSIQFDLNNCIFDAENSRIGLGTNTFATGEKLVIQSANPIAKLKDSTGAFSVSVQVATTGGGAGNAEINVQDPAHKLSTNAANLRGNALETSDLGEASRKWNNIYAVNGTIITSDINEKQDIQEISDKEIIVANKIKKLIKKFKLKQAVALKGDSARFHIGVIAQEVEQAFLEEDLDPYAYGILCKNKWYEHNGEVVEESEISQYPDHVEFKERLGIRYDELYAFIIASL